MGFERTFLNDSAQEKSVSVLRISGKPHEIFSEKFLDFAKHSSVAFLAKAAQTDEDPDKLFENIENHVGEIAKEAAMKIAFKIVTDIASDPDKARKICDHYVKTGELLEEIEL